MSGAEILTQVREALSRLRGSEFSADEDAGEAAERALDGCILLTREEARGMVRDAYRRGWNAAMTQGSPTPEPAGDLGQDEALAALDGCILLTREEAEKVAHVINRYVESTHFHQDATDSALALLTDPPADGDLGPTTDYDDMEC